MCCSYAATGSKKRAERLVARAKRLISFFTTPKQTERLIEIQQNMRRNQKEVNLIKKLFKIHI